MLGFWRRFRNHHPSRVVSDIRCKTVPKSVVFCHRGLGVVVGRGVVLGERVHIYPRVMIGRRSEKVLGYPVIEDDVVLYTGCVVVGDITVGRGAIVGANVVVCRDVAPGEVVKE